MRRLILFFILVIQVVCFRTVHAQFFYDKVSEEGDFDFEKPIGFYTNPRFNRVEGLFANVGVKFRPRSVSGLQFYGDIGLGFWNDSDKRFRYTGGVRKDFFDFQIYNVGPQYKHTYTIWSKLDQKHGRQGQITHFWTLICPWWPKYAMQNIIFYMWKLYSSSWSI